jgi:hypothetical protein
MRQLTVSLVNQKLLTEKLKRLRGNLNSSSVLKLEQHLEQTVTKTMHVRIHQELRLVLSISWQVTPLEQPLHEFTVLLDCQPNANKDQVFIVLILFVVCATATTFSRCCTLLNSGLSVLLLGNGMATAIDKLIALLSEPVV